MSLSKRLFRESALERLSSPEQLDQQLQVTSPRGWVALAGIWALLGMIIAWSILGTVPTREEGQGIIVTAGGLKVVVATGTGRLSDIAVHVGEDVTPGQAVATVDMHDIEDQLEETGSMLEEKRDQHDRINDFDQREEEHQAALETVVLDRLDQTIATSEQRIVRLGKRKAIVQGLVDDGMMTEIDLFDIEEQIEDAQIAIAKARHEKEQLVAANRDATFQRDRDRMKREMEIEELQLKAANLKEKLARESRVVSPFGGRVVEVRAAEQTTVMTGDPILLVEPLDSASGDLEALLYVSAGTGKRIETGMEVYVSPSTVKREEFGSMVGRVSFVADVPTSKSAMEADLGDKDLADKLTQEIGLPLAVIVSLEPDRQTPSGYRWTSSEGPPKTISAGTLCTGSVTVKRQRPVELLIPAIKKKLGVD